MLLLKEILDEQSAVRGVFTGATRVGWIQGVEEGVERIKESEGLENVSQNRPK